MSRRYDVVTFDCYGTLIDWEGGIGAAFAEEAAAAVRPISAPGVPGDVRRTGGAGRVRSRSAAIARS